MDITDLLYTVKYKYVCRIMIPYSITLKMVPIRIGAHLATKML